MTPTNELRWLRRKEQGNGTTFERTVLQQLWVMLNQDGEHMGLEEWRDVPLVTEAQQG